jgi:hypothetical protein
VIILVGGFLILGTGCTPAQTRAWLAWHHDDPEAAVAYLDTPEGQALLDDQVSDSDGPQFLEYLQANGSPGDCDSYVPLFQKYGLPVARFRAIAWRESGCDHTSFVRDRDDLGGGLLGINLRAGASNWFAWCGLTVNNVTNAETNVRCAAEAYQRMGMAPWS